MFGVFFWLTEVFAYIWYLMILLSTVTAFTIFAALYKHCLIYPICLLQYTYWSGSSHESSGPQGLPLCFAACPQRPVFTTIPHKSSTSVFKKCWDRKLRSCSNILISPSLSCCFTCSTVCFFSSLYFWGISYMKPRPNL